MDTSIILNILIFIVAIVAIAFIFLAGRRKYRSRLVLGSASNDSARSTEVMSNDILSRTIKCNRCGRRAYGILGTSDVYRCQSCGHNTRKASESGAYSEKRAV